MARRSTRPELGRPPHLLTRKSRTICPEPRTGELTKRQGYYVSIIHCTAISAWPGLRQNRLAENDRVSSKLIEGFVTHQWSLRSCIRQCVIIQHFGQNLHHFGNLSAFAMNLG